MLLFLLPVVTYVQKIAMNRYRCVLETTYLFLTYFYQMRMSLLVHLVARSYICGEGCNEPFSTWTQIHLFPLNVFLSD